MPNKFREVPKSTNRWALDLIFKSYLYYFSLVWAQNLTLQKDCLLLQKKGLRLTLFLRRDAHVNTLFKDCNILEFHAVIRLHLRTLS